MNTDTSNAPCSALFRVVFWDPDEKADRTADLEASDLPEAIRIAQRHYNYPRRVFLVTNASESSRTKPKTP